MLFTLALHLFTQLMLEQIQVGLISLQAMGVYDYGNSGYGGVYDYGTSGYGGVYMIMVTLVMAVYDYGTSGYGGVRLW